MATRYRMRTAALLSLLICSAQTYGGSPRSEDIEFVSHGATLSGTIVLPPDGDAHAGVVFIHGSGEQRRDLYWAERFASKKIAALVYDKRGVGKSGGEYEQNQNVSEKNISLLANDAVAALKSLSTHEALKSIPLGFAGISQAGWIAPVAAQRTELASFLVLWSGPVCKVSEEDIYSKYTADADKDVVPSFEEALRSRKQKYVWPDFLGRDTDSSEDLERLSIPGLWIFSDNDASIPVDISIERLNALRRKGHRYDYVLFSGLGHNNMDRTFHVATDWIARTSQPHQREAEKTSAKR